MKVIKEGKWKLKWEKEVVCTEPSCGATLLAEEADLHAVDYSSKDDFYAECAVCGHHIVLAGKEIPLRIARELNLTRKYSTWSD